jgi:hypothetical protein
MSLACDEIKNDVMNLTCLCLAILYINRLDQTSVDEIIEIILSYFICPSVLLFMNKSFSNPSTYQNLFVDLIIFWGDTEIQQASPQLLQKKQVSKLPTRTNLRSTPARQARALLIGSQ